MANRPLYEFTSHIEGKNAKVQIWPDRIEWERKAISGGKVAAGLMTLGTSTLFTGLRGKDTDMIPIKKVSSVTTHKGIGFNTVVRIHTAGGAVEFRVSHKEAEQTRTLVNRLMLEDGVTTVQVQQAPAQAPVPGLDVASEIARFADLRDRGILTDAEFAAKKTQLLA